MSPEAQKVEIVRAGISIGGMLYVIMLASIMQVMLMLMWVGFTHGGAAPADSAKIECFLHRDNADVHKFCVDHGYDR